MVDPNYDFSGYATKHDIKCSDGRTIQKDAFKHQDGMRVPLVWAHVHSEPGNILGHAVLESRDDGVYAYCYFNQSDSAKTAKELVKHKDVESLSIYANDLLEKSKLVMHGNIREISLVLTGANPGARIDYLAVAHADGSIIDSDDEAIIIHHSPISQKEDAVVHADSKKSEEKKESEENEKTVEEVLSTFTEEQMNLVYAMVGQASGEKEEVEHSNSGDDKVMKSNVFDKSTTETKEGLVLTHAQFSEIAGKAKDHGGSLKQAFASALAHAGTYGIDNIGVLFPTAQTVTPTPDFVKRDTDWVDMFLNAAKHTPFSRIKSSTADITGDPARAKGYVTAALKIEEVFALASRETTPTTVYKKQKLDRDDIVDITDLDVVSFLKSEMRVMLDEEIARAALVGDGRNIANPDKIDETKIRPVYKDAALYVYHAVSVVGTTVPVLIKDMIKARKYYKRPGNPLMFTTTDLLTDMLLIEDTTGRRIYNTVSDLAAALRVSGIVEVPVLEGVTRVDGATTIALKAILVNPRDYTFGADKGGQIALFDDFDIDYNQYKYLMETRVSGCLVHPNSALIIEQALP